jgi:hypothetical protein
VFYFRVFLLFTLALLFALPVCAQDQSANTTLLKTEAGVLWVHNGADLHFTLEIKGKEIRPLREFPYLAVDGRVLQTHVVSFDKFYPNAPKDSNVGLVLKRHQAWEVDHHSKLLGAKLNVKAETLTPNSNREALLWSYPMSAGLDADVQEQTFLTTVLGRYLLVLNRPLAKGEAPAAARDFLLAVLSTLEVSATPIDLQALQTKLREGLPTSTRPLRVLFIGNSYTYFNNLPQMLAGLAKSAKPARTLETEMVVIGGATLKRLWDDGKAVAVIKSGGWDYVVLQEQSTLGIAPMVTGTAKIADPKVFHEYARLFDAEIKQAGARTIFYLTWAQQNAPETQAQLTAAYQAIASELKATLAPVGLAWEAALKKNPGLGLHSEDKRHPTPAGTYLAACVFYVTLYGQSPEGLASIITGQPLELLDGSAKSDAPVELVRIDAPAAKQLQRIAWEKACAFSAKDRPNNRAKACPSPPK